MTYFSGEIQFSNKKSYYLAKQCFDHEGDSNFGLYESDFNDTSFNINISEELKNPIVFLISSNWNNLSNEDKEYLNLELQKIKGIKKNDVKYW